jgi:hypothetical protein
MGGTKTEMARKDHCRNIAAKNTSSKKLEFIFDFYRKEKNIDYDTSNLFK